jgi:hypothetical protein
MIRRLALATLAGALTYGCTPAPVASPKPSEVGRFVIVHSPEAERDTILLDTVTGRTWSRVEVTDITDEPPAWDPMPQLNSAKDLEALVAVHGSKAKSPPPQKPPASN